MAGRVNIGQGAIYAPGLRKLGSQGHPILPAYPCSLSNSTNSMATQGLLGFPDPFLISLLATLT